MSEPKILITFGMLSASTTDVPVIIALVKPMPIMAPISVWELDAGNPKYQVPRFQIIAASNMEKTIARPCAEPMLSRRSVGSICTMAYATLRPPSKTPKKVKHRRHDNRQLRTHRTGVNHGCDCIGCVMEAVNRFVEQHKSQSKQ